jgi:IrrE N-terminal-like domain
MSLRRGFKTEAEYHANEIRKELRLRAHSPLCPWKLAEFLEIPIHPLSKFRDLADEEISFLFRNAASAFSAVTLFFGRHRCRRKIVFNDGNARTRQTADISHELSHAILGHPATMMFEDDPVLDEEAKWMGPCLLIPKAAAFWILRNRLTTENVVREYGVSPALAQMRLRASGAQIIVSRSQRKSG